MHGAGQGDGLPFGPGQVARRGDDGGDGGGGGGGGDQGEEGQGKAKWTKRSHAWLQWPSAESGGLISAHHVFCNCVAWESDKIAALFFTNPCWVINGAGKMQLYRGKFHSNVNFWWRARTEATLPLARPNEDNWLDSGLTLHLNILRHPNDDPQKPPRCKRLKGNETRTKIQNATLHH